MSDEAETQIAGAENVRGAKRNRCIVFFGNCQVLALQTVYNKYVRPYSQTTTHFVDAYNLVTEESYSTLASADIVVTQEAQWPAKMGREAIPQSAAVHLVPVVSGGFLWPFQGQMHPKPPLDSGPYSPYMPEYCDRFLNDLIAKETPPEEALQIYKSVDISEMVNLDRIYELVMESQQKLDNLTGFNCASIIRDNFRDEHLFQSAFHLDARIMKHLSTLLFRRMGVSERIIEAIQRTLRSGPFVARWTPIHPSIVRHFGLRYINERTRYPFLSEGAYTFDEYVVRYMRSEWNGKLQIAIHERLPGDHGVRQMLESALRSSPDSGLGHHLLSVALEHEGLRSHAISASAVGAALAPEEGGIAYRLGALLFNRGDYLAAEGAFWRATIADPVSPACHAALRDCRLRLAVDDGRRATDLAPDPEANRVVLDRMLAVGTPMGLAQKNEANKAGKPTEVNIDFGRTGNAGGFLGHGWSGQEENHIWSIGPLSTLVISEIEPDRDYRVSLKIGACVFPPEQTKTHLRVVVRGEAIAEFFVAHNATFECRVRADMVAPDGSLIVFFDHPGFVAPSDFGHPDTRKLAICFRSVRFIACREADDY